MGTDNDQGDENEVEIRAASALKALKENAGVLTLLVTAAAVVVYGLQLSAMRAQIRETHEIFLSTERPWVSNDIRLVSPLTWNATGGHFTLQFTLKNLGHSPAVDISIIPELVPLIPGHNPPREEQRRISQEPADAVKIPVGHVLFPGDPSGAPQNIAFTIPNDMLDEFQRPLKRNLGHDTQWIPDIYVVGFIEYRLIFGGEYHQTGFIVNLEKGQPNGLSFGLNRGEDVPLDNLKLTFSPFGDGITN